MSPLQYFLPTTTQGTTLHCMLEYRFEANGPIYFERSDWSSPIWCMPIAGGNVFDRWCLGGGPKCAEVPCYIGLLLLDEHIQHLRVSPVTKMTRGFYMRDRYE